MSALVVVLGIVGLLAAAAALAELAVDAARRHQYLDIIVALAVVAIAVSMLIAHGHVFLQ